MTNTTVGPISREILSDEELKALKPEDITFDLIESLINNDQAIVDSLKDLVKTKTKKQSLLVVDAKQLFLGIHKLKFSRTPSEHMYGQVIASYTTNSLYQQQAAHDISHYAKNLQDSFDNLIKCAKEKLNRSGEFGSYGDKDIVFKIVPTVELIGIYDSDIDEIKLEYEIVAEYLETESAEQVIKRITRFTKTRLTKLTATSPKNIKRKKKLQKDLSKLESEIAKIKKELGE